MPTFNYSAVKIILYWSETINSSNRQRQKAVIRRLIGGAVTEVDILTRSHVHLLAAIEKLAARNPELATQVELHLAGVLSKSDRELAERSPFVRAAGYLPHRETVQLMRSADLLLALHERVSKQLVLGAEVGVRELVLAGEVVAGQRLVADLHRERPHVEGVRLEGHLPVAARLQV